MIIIFQNIFNWIRSLFPCFSNSNSNNPSSLINIGANCYLNSALQGISSCDVFLGDLSKLHEKYKLEKLSLFHKLIDILNGGKSDKLEISRNPIFTNWNKPGQQDSFELLAYVMNQVYNEIRKHLEDEKRIQKRNMQEWLKENLPMRIIIVYEIKCPCNNKVEVPLQSDLALHVAIPSDKSLDLQNLVDRYFQEDNIEDYKCENEKCDGKNTKRYTRLLQPLPRTVCIHLQRTFWNGVKMKKIDHHIKFSHDLKIRSKFTVSHNSKMNVEVVNQNDENISNSLFKSDIIDNDQAQNIAINHSLNETLSENDSQQKSYEGQIKDFDETYYLMSVIIHYGSVHGGHYVCYKKMNNKWFITDDSSIKEISEDEVLNCKAYILFYENKKDFCI